jgi:hypothetical protein
MVGRYSISATFLPIFYPAIKPIPRWPIDKNSLTKQKLFRNPAFFHLQPFMRQIDRFVPISRILADRRIVSHHEIFPLPKLHGVVGRRRVQFRIAAAIGVVNIAPQADVIERAFLVFGLDARLARLAPMGVRMILVQQPTDVRRILKWLKRLFVVHTQRHAIIDVFKIEKDWLIGVDAQLRERFVLVADFRIAGLMDEPHPIRLDLSCKRMRHIDGFRQFQSQRAVAADPLVICRQFQV